MPMLLKIGYHMATLKSGINTRMLQMVDRYDRCLKKYTNYVETQSECYSTSVFTIKGFVSLQFALFELATEFTF